MEKNVVIDMLKRIESLIYSNELCIAKEYVQLEIDNLEGTTPNKCRFISKPSHCNMCRNLNCPDNKKQKNKQ